jgi:hypothetical protein
LPGGFRQVAPWQPDGATVSAARGVVSLPDSDLGHPLLVLGIWLALSLAMLACVDLLHLAELRRAPEGRPRSARHQYGIPAAPARLPTGRRTITRAGPGRLIART